MDVSFIVAVSIFILFVSLVIVSVVTYFTRTPQSEVVLELQDKTLNLFNIFFGSRGLVTNERVTVDLIRVPVLIEEMGNKNWTNEIIGVDINFDEVCGRKQAWNNSIRAYDTLFVELPSLISNQELCTSNWLNRSVVTFVVNLTTNQTKRTYVYSINNSNTTAPSYNITNLTGIVGYWNFNEGNGTFAKDFSGNGNNGTLKNGTGTCTDNNCPLWSSDLFVKSIRFDGVNDHVNVGSGSTLRPSADLTWTVWIKRSGSGTGTNPAIIKFGEDGEPFFTERGTDGVMRAGIKTSVSGEITVIDSLAIPSTWTHYSLMYNGTGLGLWRNGTLVNSTSASGTVTYDNNTLTIGGDGNDEFWNGTVDDFRIYGKSLTSTEISNLASSIPRITLFPAENITAISAEKVQTLKSRLYEDINSIIGEGYDFRIEIREK